MGAAEKLITPQGWEVKQEWIDNGFWVEPDMGPVSGIYQIIAVVV